MKVVIAADHAGFPLKATVIDTVRAAGHEPIDLGTFSEESVDYPDFAQKVGQAILQGQAERGILVCGSGIGACIAANKMRGIYASVAHDTYSAAQGVEHDAMNVLCLGARIVGIEVAKTLIRAFLEAEFSREPRHQRRVDKIHKIESDNLGTL
jgi:ribose 5-phosphate isomerase B